MRGDHASACDYYAQALDATPPEANWRHDLVINALNQFVRSGHLQAALTIADTEMSHWARSPDFYFVMGDLFLEAATPSRSARSTIGCRWPRARGNAA